MNLQRDELEMELESIDLPRLPTALRERIAKAVEADQQAPSLIYRRISRARITGWVLGGALAAAACVTLGFVWFHGRQSNPGMAKHLDSPQTLPTAVHANVDQPVTLAAYTRAAGRSSAEVDALLDIDASRPLGRGPRAFTHSIDDLTN
jgi:predicted membrane-bound mannosyltransferase